MSGSLAAYVAQVDQVMSAGQRLFIASSGPAGAGGAEVPSPPAPPGRGGLTVGARGAGEAYRERWSTASALDARTTNAGADAKAEAERGSRGTTGVRESARSQATAIAPATTSPAGVKLMVSTMDERLAAMQRELATTKAQNAVLAQRLRQLAMAYRGTPAGGGLGSPMTAALGAPNGGGRGTGPAGMTMPSVAGLLPTGRRSTGTSTRDAARLAGLFGRDQRVSGSAGTAVAHAKTKLGLPYVWGATGPRAYDCSGLVQDAYAKAGVSLPRTTYDQITLGDAVSRADIRAGDLVFSNFSSRGPEHVQMAVSPTMVIEAPGSGGHVQYSTIPSGRIVVRRVA